MEPISTIATSVGVKFVKDIFNKKALDWFEKGERLFIDAISNNIGTYLGSQKNYYSEVKTILTGSRPVEFRKIYYPLSLTTERLFSCSNDIVKISKCSITNVFQNSDYVLLYGDAGSGKSSIVRHLFLECIEKEVYIPILIELRRLNLTGIGLQAYIFENLLSFDIKNNDKKIAKLLQQGTFAFFFDGFDEVMPDLQERLISEIESFVRQYGVNKFVITSRPYSDITQLSQFHNYRVENLTDDDVFPFTFKQISAMNDELTAEEFAVAINESVVEHEIAPYIKSFMRNPLLLSVYIFTFGYNPSIPISKSQFYSRVVEMLLEKHDGITKVGFRRARKTKLNNDQFEAVLSMFSFVTYMNAKYEWEQDLVNQTLNKIKARPIGIQFKNDDFIDDMKSSFSLWIDESGKYKFVHRELQEYFVALFMKNKNSENKYKEFFDRVFLDKTRFGTLHYNVFSMFQELDFVNVNKYFILPMLQDISNIISPLTGRELVECCLLIFTDMIEIKFIKNKDNEISICGSSYSLEKMKILLNMFNKRLDMVDFTLAHLKVLHKTQNLYSILYENAEWDSLTEMLQNIQGGLATFKQLVVFANGKLPDVIWELCGDMLAYNFENYKTVIENECKMIEIQLSREESKYEIDDIL